jgi:hypothetical protein
MNVLRLKGISRNSRLLYAVLCGYRSKESQHPFPSEQTLAEDLDCGKSTVHRLKEELKKAGLIDWETKPGGSNIYTIYDFPIVAGDKGTVAIGDKGTTVTDDKGVLPRVTTEWKPSNVPQLNGNHVNGTHTTNGYQSTTLSNFQQIRDQLKRQLFCSTT